MLLRCFVLLLFFLFNSAVYDLFDDISFYKSIPLRLLKPILPYGFIFMTYTWFPEHCILLLQVK